MIKNIIMVISTPILVPVILPWILCYIRLSNQARLINDLDINNTQEWKYLGNVDGTSGWGNLAASTDIQKNEAKEKQPFYKQLILLGKQCLWLFSIC